MSSQSVKSGGIDPDSDDDKMKVDNPPKEEPPRVPARPKGVATSGHTCDKGSATGGDSGKGKVQNLSKSPGKPSSSSATTIKLSAPLSASRTPLKKSTDLIIGQHSPRVPDMSSKSIFPSAEAGRKPDEASSNLLQSVAAQAAQRSPVPKTPNKSRGIPKTTSSARFGSSSKYPKNIPIEDSDSDDPNDDAMSKFCRFLALQHPQRTMTVTFATDSSFLSTQEVAENPPGSKQTSLSSMNSADSPSRKRARSTSKESPRVPKAPRTPSHNSSISRPFNLPFPTEADVVFSEQSGSIHSSGSLLERIWKKPSLPVSIIAHHKELQVLYDSKNVGWGTQWMLMRGVMRGEWTVDDIKSKIGELAGPDTQKLHLVPYIMHGRDAKSFDNTIGVELDREQAAIVENKGRGLGLMGEWHGTDKWFGGRVQFVATLEQAKDKKYGFQLEQIEMKRSNRVARALGSRRVIQIRIGKVNLNSTEERVNVTDFLSQRFVLNGRVFLVIPPKDDVLYAIEVNADYERRSQMQLGDHLRWTLGQFLDWHNPLECNDKQAVAKYFARIALGLSVSVPAIEFQCDRIKYIPDIVAEDCQIASEDKPPAEKVLTDGCGLINQAALATIAEVMGYRTIPAAVQGRIAGAKGLWMLHPNDEDPIPTIWIRDSQNKIQCRDLDRAHRVFDLLAASHPKSQPTLSKQTVVNLWANGVGHRVLRKLMEVGVKEQVELLTSWGRDPTDMAKLWDAINHLNGVTTTRISRIAGSKSRAAGITGREFGSGNSWMDFSSDKSSEQGGKTDISVEESDGSRDPITGMPLSLPEKVMEMLQCGHHPMDLQCLAKNIKQLLKQAMDKFVDKCHIPLTKGHGFDAFVVPDPIGVLGPNEIYYRSSEGFVDPKTKLTEFVLRGDVLIGRYPVRLPSDIQKVTAVDHPDLWKWQDVIVVPTNAREDDKKGLISFMSILGGGDLDGDDAFVIRDPEIVEPFQSKPLTLPPSDLENDFKSAKQQTTDFVKELRTLLSTDKSHEAQKLFYRTALLGLTDSKVGIYSGWCDNAAKKYGYDSPEAIRLAYIFTTLLDGGKTGLVLKPEVSVKDSKADLNIRNHKNSKFILEILASHGRRLGDNALATLARRIEPLNYRASLTDPLRQPHAQVEDLVRQAEESCRRLDHRCDLGGVVCEPCKEKIVATSDRDRLKQDLRRLEEHVREVHENWKRGCSKAGATAEPDSPSKRDRDRLHWQKLAKSVVSTFHQRVTTSPFFPEEEVKASYAYRLGHNFGFEVAYKTLNRLKAESCYGGAAPSNRFFDSTRTMGGGTRKLFD
ncbi:hypothetical protein V5O48_003747 [Marasmius crinis-equi]|uniref:RNA-dependent RNA polymerase n=1 Tax=Marasmius crinis-equi TaxID=585013 RepID=A0ABR3FSG9_9AGAR